MNLINTFSGRGLVPSRDWTFEELYPVTGIRGRVVWSERKSWIKGTLYPTGISFWIHRGSSLTFLGFFSGNIYLIEDPRQLVTIALDAECHTPGTPPYKIKEKHLIFAVRVEFLSCFSREVDAVLLSDAKNARSGLPFTKSEFLNNMSGTVDAVTLQRPGFVKLQLGSASALVRFGVKAAQFIGMMMYGGVRETYDQIRLLNVLMKQCKCTIYHNMFGNKILLGDPYYGPPTPSRPHLPMGWPAMLRRG